MEKLLEMMEELAGAGIPSAYDHFAEGESPAPPFITYLIPGADNFAADGKAYFKVDEVHVELYTDAKDPDLEDLVEDVLDSHEVYYSKSEVWIESEKLYEVMYTFQMKRHDSPAPATPVDTDSPAAPVGDTENGSESGTENSIETGTVNDTAETEDPDEPDTGAETAVSDGTEGLDGGTANEE